MDIFGVILSLTIQAPVTNVNTFADGVNVVHLVFALISRHYILRFLGVRGILCFIKLSFD